MNVRNTDPDGRRIKIALGLASAAIFGVKALTGRPAENSSRTFDICVEDFKVFNVIAQVTFLNHDPKGPIFTTKRSYAARSPP